MLKQEPLPTHDGRPGNRGSVVNIASQLGIVGRPAARTYPSLSLTFTLLAFLELKLTFSAAYCGSKAAVISMTRCDVRFHPTTPPTNPIDAEMHLLTAESGC